MTSSEAAGVDGVDPTGPGGAEHGEGGEGPPRRRKHVPWRGTATHPTAETDEAAEPDEAAEVAAVRAQNRAEQNQSMRERGRQIGGVPGAMMAGLMVALRDIYEAPPRDNGAVVVDSPSEPHDADRDGMDFAAGELDGDADVTIAALAPRMPITATRRSRGVLRRWSRRRT